MNNYSYISNELEQEVKDSSSLVKSKFDYELFNEEFAAIVHPCAQVKRVGLPNKGEKWKFFENSKQFFVLEGTKLTKKEREFLRTVEGIQLLLKCGKHGVKNFTQIHKIIKQAIVLSEKKA